MLSLKGPPTYQPTHRPSHRPHAGAAGVQRQVGQWL